MKQISILDQKGIEMHSYLRAIGFSKYTTKKSIIGLLTDVKKIDGQSELTGFGDDKLVELRKLFGKNIGIAWNGTSVSEKTMDIDYYFPFVVGQYNNIHEDVTVEKRYEKNAFLGACEDLRVGVSMIFHVQNAMDIMHMKARKKEMPRYCSVIFSALSLSGMVLLPIKMSPNDENKKKQALKRRTNLISAARQGDESAMEALTFEDMDTYAKISKRLAHEDVFTIVASSFMTYGLESDMYSIIADIATVEIIRNQITGEGVYLLTLNYNDVLINLAINEMDLEGEPQPGRRFKGNIWLQGRIILPRGENGE
ncbi:MAG: DUF3881 family protein [Lachnospiraceae bacterium]|nr:DUF3881 family protein [Lachnospiraceae bacterium]